jgi:cobalt transporter subunit CbtA
MFQRMLASALFAGAAAGLIAALLHFAFVQHLIVLAEQYETGALTHFTTGSAATDAAPAAEAGHTHAAGTAEAGHSHAPAAETSDLQRNGLTVLFMGLVYIAYGMLLTAGFGLAESMGLRIGPMQGLLWGIAGFAAFQLAPAMGLAPELPGTLAADLGARQIWWWSTVAATATGLGLLAYGRQIWVYPLAHVIGAPEIDGFHGVVPPEVASAFAARVLGAALVAWACLGGLAGHFWSRPATA